MRPRFLPSLVPMNGLVAYQSGTIVSFRSVNRDTDVDGPLYASSKIKQEHLEFSKLFSKFGQTASRRDTNHCDL
jgi:hypothetical protein